MVCLYCAHNTRVVNSRSQKKTNQIWRRRLCINCRSIFTTTEAIVYKKEVLVSKGTALEPFSRDKLFISLYSSLKHRATALSDARELCDTISSRLISLLDKEATIEAQKITNTTQVCLNRFDKVASTHYRAFH